MLTSLPKKLAARITTLRKACPAATFEAGPPPGGCSEEARVGSATVTTPVLPGPLTGPAYLVSHGGEAYPDLDVILSGDGGVEVVLVGHTHIARTGILSSSFESLPDVPISSFALSLPIGPHSVLTDNRNGTLCGSQLSDAHDDRRAERGADRAAHEDRRQKLPAAQEAGGTSTWGTASPGTRHQGSSRGTEAPRPPALTGASRARGRSQK